MNFAYGIVALMCLTNVWCEPPDLKYKEAEPVAEPPDLRYKDANNVMTNAHNFLVKRNYHF